MSWHAYGAFDQIGPQRVRVTISPDYVDDLTGERVTPDVGFESDGTTFPKRLYWLTGHPLNPLYLPAAVNHDWEIHTKSSTWLRVHTRYCRMLRDRGVSPWRSFAMGIAVLLYGPRW